jgi:chromosome segregation ATPase
MRYGVLFTVCLFVTAASVPVVAEESGDSGSATLLEEVAGLRASVNELVRLLERHMGYQKTELMLKRIDLKQRQLEPLERELRNSNNLLESRQDEIDQLAMFLEQIEREIDDEIRAGTDTPDSDSRGYRQEVELQRTKLEERIGDLEREILDLEGEVAYRQRELEDLEEILEDFLEE